MGRMRFDRRSSPIQRTWTMLKVGVLRQVPAWFDAVRLFPAPAPAPYRLGAPPKLEYLEDTLLENFHRQYKRYFGDSYSGVNHLGKLKNDQRPRNSYRYRFVSEQARVMREFPHLSEEEAFDLVVPYMEKERKVDRNKLALMTRYMLDTKGKGENRSLLEIQRHGDANTFERGVYQIKRRIVAENHLIRNLMSGAGLSSKKYMPRKSESGEYDYGMDKHSD